MMKTNKLILLFALPGFMACKKTVILEPDLTTVTEFPMKKETKVSVIKTDSIILAPEKIFILNDQIWVCQRKKDKIFDVFDLLTGRHLYSTGTKGQGPNDFIHPQANTIAVEGDKFTLLDINVMKTVRITPSGQTETVDAKRTFDLLPVNGFVKLNDTVFCAFADCATGTVGDYEYRQKNISTENESKFSPYPEFLSDRKFEDEQRCRIYYKYPVANPHKNKMATFYGFFKFFRIYDYNGVMEKQVFVKIPPYSSDNVDDWEKREVYYGPPSATEDYIYAPCGAGEIQVWDWQGNPVIQYSFDRPFYTFAVSEPHKKIFMVSAEEEDLDKIYTADLVHLPS
ncbi:MAG: TolB-like 6-bladed beta-propeller domain-containing protein [Proteiniphilum sp.]|jgi:hypothetical protein|nr:TolB-like 6-bladed beta-propeller domain-containing protein [Proteiniphilum sp.]